MAKFLQSFSILLLLSLLLSGASVNGVNGKCQKMMDVYCKNDKFDHGCDDRCMQESPFGQSSCFRAPGVRADVFLCMCTYPCS